MNNCNPRPYSFLRISLMFILLLMAETEARGSIPPTLLAQQQDRAMRVYCTHWRRTGRKGALEGDDVKQVVIELEVLYPTAFPACRRPGDEGYCHSWLKVLAQGLRRYGHRSLREICF